MQTYLATRHHIKLVRLISHQICRVWCARFAKPASSQQKNTCLQGQVITEESRGTVNGRIEF